MTDVEDLITKQAKTIERIGELITHIDSLIVLLQGLEQQAHHLRSEQAEKN